MKLHVSTFVLLLFTGLYASNSCADSITGNQYLKLSERDAGWYFVGVLDAMKQTRDQYLRNSDLDKEEFDKLWDACISGRPIRQHIAIVEAWLNDNPSRWQEPAIELIFAAEKDACDEVRESDSVQ